MKGRCWLVVCLGLAMTLTLWTLVTAAAPPQDDPDQGEGRQVGLVSTLTECLIVRAGKPDSAVAIARLEWDGQIEEAFLVLSVAGSDGGHSIYVNGRRVGSVPARPGGQPCLANSTASALVSTDAIPIPPDVLIQGDNVIRLTNDADFDDGWSAANLHVEIHGVLGGPPVAALEDIASASSALGVEAVAAISGTVPLISSYELAQGSQVITQLVSYQIPTGYTGSAPVPLLIGIHGLGSTGQWIRDFLATEANDRGWLLAAPDMHSDYYINTGWFALAYVGAQHDIIDTVDYMMSMYNVDPSRIYIFGESMGGQIATVMAAKYPDVFAAMAESIGFTDLTDWYYELEGLGDQSWALERIRNETGGTPSAVPFEYERRSAIEMPQNSRLIPLHLWHSQADGLVPVHHAYDLADAINGWTPSIPVTVTTVVTAGCTDPHKHCYEPDLEEVFDYLAGYTLSSQPAPSARVRTDESKPYYWLNLAQTGGDHWTQVQASYDVDRASVTAAILDSHPLTVAFNLGAAPIMGRVTERPGIGLPATTYLVNGGGNYELEEYVSGYLTTTLSTMGQFTLTVSAVAVQVSAEPAMVLGGQVATSTITVVAEDGLNNPVPDGTTVELTTTEGSFPGGGLTYVTTTTEGQAAAVLSLGSIADLAEITALVSSVAGSTSLDMIRPAVDLKVTPSQTTIYSGQTVTLTYRVTNTGDITLTGVAVVEVNGTPGNGDDDFTVCEYTSLPAGATKDCTHGRILTRTTASIAIVTGWDPLGHEVIGSDSTTVTVYTRVYLPVVTKSR